MHIRTRLFYTLFALHQHTTHLATEEVRVPDDVIHALMRVYYDQQLFRLWWTGNIEMHEGTYYLSLDDDYHLIYDMNSRGSAIVPCTMKKEVFDGERLVRITYDLLDCVDAVKQDYQKTHVQWDKAEKRLAGYLRDRLIKNTHSDKHQ